MTDSNSDELALPSVTEIVEGVAEGLEEAANVVENLVTDVISDFNQLVINLQPSPFDPRDWIAEHRYPMGEANPPATLDLRSWLPKVRNQGNRNTCAGFSAAGIKEYQERRDCRYERNMSHEFIYYYRSNKPKEGMFSRDLMSILSKRGCCTEQTFPYKRFRDAGSVPVEADEEAAYYKIKGYARVLTVEGLKMALYKDGPCLMAFPVYDNMPEFWNAKPGQTLAGGHATIAVGYNKEGFIIRNSWGSVWNGDGHVIYKYADFGAHWEIYTTFDEEGSPHPDTLPDRPPQPKPDDGGCTCALI